MATNGTLQLATNYVQTGLGTLTFTVPATLPPNGISVVNIPFIVGCQVTFPQADQEGFGAGSGADKGLGVTGGVAGISTNNTSLGQGGLGLGFGGSVTDGASGNGSGLGNGSGGGTLGGFALGGGGLSDGAKGLAFGADNSGYNQPSTLVTVPTSYAAILSSLAVVVKLNGSTVYTAPTIAGIQSGQQFTTNLLLNAADVVTIVFSSALAADNVLQAIKANVSIYVGET